MRPALLLAAAGLVAAAGGAAVVSHTSTAAIAGAEAFGSVHATTEADLVQLRQARPTLDGPVLVGLRLRWCVAQETCR